MIAGGFIAGLLPAAVSIGAALIGYLAVDHMFERGGPGASPWIQAAAFALAVGSGLALAALVLSAGAALGWTAAARVGQFDALGCLAAWSVAAVLLGTDHWRNS